MARPRERRQSHEPREKSEFDQRVLDIRRTARVVKGGRRFSFRASVVVGNRNGRVGIGIGKGPDVSTAIEKSANNARKNLINVAINEDKTISHFTEAKYAAARVMLRPAGAGKGLVAGGPVRAVADLVGIKNLTAKILGRTVNKLNNARATIEALKKLKSLNPKP